MIDELDEVLRKLLVRELPIRNGDVNIEFAQPKREWSARLSRRPTLNLFLHELHENNTLRQPEWQVKRNTDGTTTKQRTPARVDLHYMLTAWATDVDDEHRLMARTLMALMRYPILPADLLTDNLRSQAVPIPMRIAEQDAMRNPADIWGAMDNELRPAITCIITLAFNPHQAISGPVVKTRDLRFQQPHETIAADRFWMVGGTLRGGDSFERVRLTVLERGLDVPVQPNGDFIIGNLEKGDYTLNVSADGRKAQRHTLSVPSASYDFDWEEGGKANKFKD